MRKIAINLETQKRNASRSLPVSSLYVCMAINHIIIVLFVETPRKFITAVINLRGVSTNKTIICLYSSPIQ